MDKEFLKILLVEDDPHDALSINQSLTSVYAGKFELQHVEKLSRALKFVSRFKFDIVLLDLSLPDSRGLDTVRGLCAADLPIPIIVLNDLEDDSLALQVIQCGAQDYLIKNQASGHFLTRAISHAIARKGVVEHLKYTATHDELTGLPNRVLFYDRLQHALARADRTKDKCGSHWKTAVMMIDLDNFKLINDTLGHAKGDQVLKLVAERLRGCLRESDTIARLGGDEFVILIEGTAAAQDCVKVAQKIIGVLTQPFEIDGREYRLGTSIGISQYPDDGSDSDTLFKHSDIAMYQAKNEKNAFKFYEDAMESEWINP